MMIKAMPAAVRAESKAVIHRSSTAAARETPEKEVPPPAPNRSARRWLVLVVGAIAFGSALALFLRVL